jgi:hypothetical protein
MASLSTRIAPSGFHRENLIVQLCGDVGSIPDGGAVRALIGEVFKLLRHVLKLNQ